MTTKAKPVIEGEVEKVAVYALKRYDDNQLHLTLNGIIIANLYGDEMYFRGDMAKREGFQVQFIDGDFRDYRPPAPSSTPLFRGHDIRRKGGK